MNHSKTAGAAPDRLTVAEPSGAYGAAAAAAKTASAVLFSIRELEVLRLVAADWTSQEIAEHLCISPRTVETHRRMMLEKAGTRSMIGLVSQSVRHGWVTVV